METATAKIVNMANQEDADKIMAALESVWGFSRAEVNLSKGEAHFTFDERMASLEDFTQAINDTGYEVAQNNHSQ